MTINVKKLHPHFMAEIGGVNLTEPVGETHFRDIKAAFDQHAVLLFRNQPITDEDQIAFTKLFGPIITKTNYHRPGEIARISTDLSDVSNLDHNGELLPPDSGRRLHSRANRLWHTDASFKHIPARCSMLSAHELPPVGGNTAFADMRTAYDALPDQKQAELQGLTAWHSIFHSREKMGHTDYNQAARDEVPPAHQMLIRTHPETGRKSLYLASHISSIDGMVDDAAHQLVDELIAHATQPQFIYEHEWQVGDLIIWDNRYTMHRAMGHDDINHRRDMRRSTVSDEINSIDLQQEIDNRPA
jgi:alpha-ketoglutarate-dependent 2,4-dichlorophenoxyacetate dioxygenase